MHLAFSSLYVSTLGFYIGSHIQREYWCSYQDAESREISIRCKNLFLSRCKINMFKLTNFSLLYARIQIDSNLSEV